MRFHVIKGGDTKHNVFYEEKNDMSPQRSTGRYTDGREPDISDDEYIV